MTNSGDEDNDDDEIRRNVVRMELFSWGTVSKYGSHGN